MELFDEDLKINQKTDNRKTTTIILAVIIFLIIMVLFIIGAIIYIKQTTLTVSLNGQTSNDVKNMITIDENNKQKVYVPIRRIAKKLGYNDYNGSYTTKSEEQNMCYVECEKEVAMFTLGSREIYKTLTNGDADFECFTIDEPVKAVNGELYTTIDGIEHAFNVSWNYDTEHNKMTIYTMPYLISAHTQNIVTYGYDAVSENFTNQKAVLNDKLIVEKKGDGSNKKVAVLDFSTGKMQTLLEPKYSEIQYLEHTQDFLVTADNKKGIIANDKTTKVKPQYDDIKLMDYNKKLYAVEISGKYGIINFSGEKILEADFSQIGIDDITKFKENDIRSKYIIANNMIPIKRDKWWAFFNTSGKQLTDFKYENVGYITSNNRAGSGYSLLAVPEYDVVIVGKDKKYTVITSQGEEIWGLVFDSIYLSIYGGQTSYILEYNSQNYNLTEQLDGMGYGKSNSNLNKNTEQQENKNRNESEQEENNQNNNTTQEQQNSNNENNENQNNDRQENNNEQNSQNQNDDRQESNNEQNSEEQNNDRQENNNEQNNENNNEQYNENQNN